MSKESETLINYLDCITKYNNLEKRLCELEKLFSNLSGETIDKPKVFNYRDYLKLKNEYYNLEIAYNEALSEYEQLKAENNALKIKDEKYRFHDLRKDPDDLPKAGVRILFYTDADGKGLMAYTGEFGTYFNYFYNDDHEANMTTGIYSISQVFGWRYIKPIDGD